MKTFPKQDKQIEVFKESLKTRAYIDDKVPITGRSYHNYAQQLFPDIPKTKLLTYMSKKDYLDVACGINHLYPKSLLNMIKGSRKKHGLDIHSKTEKNYYKGSIYKTPFTNESYDCITINNFLYFWEYKPDNLLKIYKELYRICKKGGEIRVFPIFFGNYHLENIELFEYMNTHFQIRVLKNRDYSDESPIYIEQGEIKETPRSAGRNEYKLNHQLMSYALILQKL